MRCSARRIPTCTSSDLTSIVVSYDVSEAVKLVDYVYVIADGVVAGEGTPDEMLGSKDPYVHQFRSDFHRGELRRERGGEARRLRVCNRRRRGRGRRNPR